MADASVSILVVEEYYALQDVRFVDALRSNHDAKRLAAFTDRWKKDSRPWARQQITDYLKLPLTPPGHEPVVKRLFKYVEGLKDDATMAACMVNFDRVIRRVRKTRRHYEWQTRTAWQEEVLVPPRRRAGLFSIHTRDYLRRRAWRYFRRMGFQRSTDYVKNVAIALRQYQEADFAKGENILDSWSIVHALFRKSPALKFGPARINLQDGHALGELSPAPQFPQLWTEAAAMPVVIDLVASAGSRLVRTWSMQLLRRDHAERLAGLAAVDLLRLLDHDDEEVQQFGAELLEKAANLDKLPVSVWLTLLKTRNLTALETIVLILEKHVAPQRFTLTQCVDLATAESLTVARLGLRFLKTKLPIRKSDYGEIARLATAQAAAAGQEIGAFALGILGTPEAYDVERVSRFFDSLSATIRSAAWGWMTSATPAYSDSALWARLLETPFEDIRLRLVAALEVRAKLPGMGTGELASLWTTVLLAIHRGGRQKLTALRQISNALRNDPDHAATLLPVVAAAIRSVRLPEARAGLSAVVIALEAKPQIASLVARHLPELRVEAVGV